MIAEKSEAVEYVTNYPKKRHRRDPGYAPVLVGLVVGVAAYYAMTADPNS